VPIIVVDDIKAPLYRVIHTRARFAGAGTQVHMRFSDTLAAFAMIALPAGRDDVFPDVKSAA